ncbi:MFS transporter [Penicillium diatomitis]|uniref:MFS transporter n=1 Tax=Penicillium diatomitis TaxID=2819901 RepID=A0A9X0BT67_9EURO|nr:MFS transporter [Penicillium diatomitis]KAJ5482829.1 MFS transporter [Penicillium diatomitis]
MDVETEIPHPAEVAAGAKGDDEEQPPASTYLHGWALAGLTMAFMAIFLVLAIDNTILATAIPKITNDFHSLNDIGWYGSSYLIAQMALLPTCGRLYTFFNIKWVYCLSLVVFELGSIVAALAPNSITLIIGRAISGLGAAGLVSGSTTILSYCVSLRKQAFLTPIVLGMYNVGSAIGPLVGGSITDNKKLTWRFIFWINLPVALALIWFTLKNPPPAVKGDSPWRQKLRQLDIPGAVILLGATSCLNLALQWGGIVYPCIGTAGSGLLASKFGHYVPFMLIGPPILATGGGLYQLINPNSPRGQWIGFQVLTGLGYGICSQMPILAVQVVLNKPDVPTGLVVIMFFQMLGGALAPSVGQNLFTTGLLQSLHEIQGGVDADAIVAAGASGFRALVPPNLMSAVVGAFNSALRNAFWVALATSALACVTALAMEWRRLPDSKPEDDDSPVDETTVQEKV